LQIKFLENMIMSLHLVQNKDAYMKKLSESVTALNAAINLNDKKIQDLNLPNQGGVVNKIKKVMGKDEETKYLKERQALYAERQNYINKRTSIFEEMKALQSNKTDAGTIQQERNELITKISQIKGRRQATTNLDDIRNEINSLKAQIQNVQTDLASLKGSGPMIQQPLRPLQTTR
jgi:DNA repair exonuclease SbcCD ATPase subunit